MAHARSKLFSFLLDFLSNLFLLSCVLMFEHCAVLDKLILDILGRDLLFGVDTSIDFSCLLLHEAKWCRELLDKHSYLVDK